MSDVALKVAYESYSGWQDVSVVRSLEQLAHTFNVSHTELLRTGERNIPISEGMPAEVSIDGERVVNGFVVDAPDSYNATSRRASFEGASRTVDLVDCAAIYKSGQWRGSQVTIQRIANDLCTPFKIGVSIDRSVGMLKPLRHFSINDGETVFEALSRAARMRGVLLLTDADGDLVIARVGSRRSSTVLRYGRNILEGARARSWRDRFSSYIVMTQLQGDDDVNGAAAAHVKRKSDDDTVDRYRPTIILAENEDSGHELQDRADWERNVRAGRSRRVTYTVQGWRDDDGALWAPNTLVSVDDKQFGIRDELLLVTVELSKSEGGELARLALSDPRAFTVQPWAPPKPQDDSLMGAL